MIREISFTRFAIPFRQPLRAGGNSWERREGIIVMVSDSSGACGIGEWSTWPPRYPMRGSVSPESIRQALGDLDPKRHDFETLPEWSDPGLTFAIHTAWMDLRARLLGEPLCKALNRDAHNRVVVNGIISQCAAGDAVVKATEMVERGIRCIKLKFGRENFADDLAVLKAVRERFPHVALRGDANGAWAPDVAVDYLKRMEPFSLEYFEEPVAGLPAIAVLQKATPIPLAADESLVAANLGEATSIPVWVVKPARIGSFSALRSTLDEARRQNKKAVITGIFEGAVGTAAVAHLAAAWLPPDVPTGIDSAPLFTRNTSAGLPFPNGSLLMAVGSGLGIALAEEPS